MSKVPKRLLISLILLTFIVMGSLLILKIESQVYLPVPLISSRDLLTVIFPKLVSSTETPSPKPLLKPNPTPTPSRYVAMTFYGWVDNSPPGKNIAYPKTHEPRTIHNQASGVGTVADPVTIAVKEGRWPPGTRMYIPILKKYGIVEDICANCVPDQIDVWMDSSSSFASELLACERKWTKERTGIELNPQPNRPVSLKAFFDIANGDCF